MTRKDAKGKFLEYFGSSPAPDMKIMEINGQEFSARELIQEVISDSRIGNRLVNTFRYIMSDKNSKPRPPSLRMMVAFTAGLLKANDVIS